MTATLTEPTVVVPVDLENQTTPSPALVDLLGPHRVVVLGYRMVPDQTPIEQYEDEFGAEARERVERVAQEFEGHSDAVSTVVFTKDRGQTVDRVAGEYAADAVLTPGQTGETMGEVLLALKGDPNIVRLVEFTGRLLANSGATVTVFHVADSDADEARAEFLLRGACDKLRELGVDPDRVGWEQQRSGSPAKTITTTAAEYDLLVVGESEPSLRQRILGGVTGRVSDRTTSPTLVVRRR